MKKILLSLVISGLAMSGYANINGNGFYRVMNYGTSRWASLIDNQASVDAVGGSADLHALQLSNNFEKMITDPGSIVYLKNISGSQYNVSAQGTTLSDLVNNPVSIKASSSVDGQSLYYIYGTYKGNVKYIGDNNSILRDEYGYASLNVTKTANKQWIFVPVDENTYNYYSVLPTVAANGKLYTANFTSFGYKPESSNVKAYYIARVYKGLAEIIEIKDAIVPPASPVIIECAGNSTEDNKMILSVSSGALPNNMLSGVYFNYYDKSFTNRVKYDANTMRVLGKCTDGSLGFITAKGLEYIPANTAYLKVAAGSPAEIKCVSTEEFEAGVDSDPDPGENPGAGVYAVSSNTSDIIYKGTTVYCDGASEISVLNIAGQTMLKSNKGFIDIVNLPKGVYIATAGSKSIKIVR